MGRSKLRLLMDIGGSSQRGGVQRRIHLEIHLTGLNVALVISDMVDIVISSAFE